jgi:hypothetical protein
VPASGVLARAAGSHLLYGGTHDVQSRDLRWLRSKAI